MAQRRALAAHRPRPPPQLHLPNGQSQFFEGNESGTKTFLFADLQLHHAYRVYCHATGLAGNPMSTAQEDATAEFMSPAVPSIELAPLASEPYALSISVTSTYFSRVRCLAKVATGDNSVPPTKETIINLTDRPANDPDGLPLPPISNHEMGTLFEELLRRFNEENNEEAGEHFTPRDVIQLLCRSVRLMCGSVMRSMIESRRLLSASFFALL